MTIVREKLRLTTLLIAAAVVYLLVALPAAEGQPSSSGTGATQAVVSPDDPVSLLWPRPREASQPADWQVRVPIRIAAPAE
jgi:hypothetical protein